MKNEQGMNKMLREQYVPNAEFYSLIINSLEDYSIFTVDKELHINSWNPGAAKIFKYATEDIIGKPFETIFTKEDIDNAIPQEEIETALNHGRSNNVRWYTRKDGTVFYADGLVFPLKNNDDVIIGYVKVLRDITARKASEDAIKKYAKDLEELNTHKETVLAILSHDLRSPLTGIIQGAEYLKSNFDSLEPAFAKELLQEFHNATVNELNMLDYLVEWARIKYAAQAFVPTKINFVSYLKKVFESLKETAAVKSIRFHNEIGEDISVFADGKMVMSILQNIVSNAIKHSHEGGQVILSAKKRDGMIIFRIQDTGIGMSKETQEKLFTPQVKSLSKAVEENKGAGIGLLLARGFIEKNGGHIWVESKLGKGSSFYFTLPINKPFNKIAILEEVETIESI